MSAQAPPLTVRVSRARFVALWAAAGLLATCAAALIWPGGWRHHSQVVKLTKIEAELFFLDVPRLARVGPGRLAVVRVNGPVRFEPHVYWDEGLRAPIAIEAWAARLGAPVVFNAGQFDEKLRHLGWLKGRGKWLEPVRKARFEGLLVSGVGPLGRAQSPPLAATRIVDLQEEGPDAAQAYDNVVQSMMLLDEKAQTRVRNTQVSACRTVVAEDRSGRTLVIVSEGAVTLHDLAQWLPQSGLNVVRAMNLDGGAESQLAVVEDDQQILLYGRYGHERLLFARPQRAQTVLPAVIAVVSGSVSHQ